MKFNISAFSHIGTQREINQDYILVNGQAFNKGFHHCSGTSGVVCFVADGIGGNNAGEYAPEWVARALSKEQTANINTDTLHKINNELLKNTNDNPALFGAATTLTGLVVTNDTFNVYHAGDSALWLLRNDLLFKVTIDQVLDETQSNSPLVSYFGGTTDKLELQEMFSIKESLPGDIFLLCSDGLIKSVKVKEIKSILLSAQSLAEKSHQLLKTSLDHAANDNISAVIIEHINVPERNISFNNE